MGSCSSILKESEIFTYIRNVLSPSYNLSTPFESTLFAEMPILKDLSSLSSDVNSTLYYIDFSSSPLTLDGSALLRSLGMEMAPFLNVADEKRFLTACNTVKNLIDGQRALFAAPVGSGGLIALLLKGLSDVDDCGLNFYTLGFEVYGEKDLLKILFSENPAMVVQVSDDYKSAVEAVLDSSGVKYFPIGCPSPDRMVFLTHCGREIMLGIDLFFA